MATLTDSEILGYWFPQGGNDVTIANQWALPVTLTSLLDNPVGDLNIKGTCSAPQTIGPGGSYSCNFAEHITGIAGDTHTNTVTGEVTDENNNSATDSYDETGKLKRSVTNESSLLF